MIEFLTSDDRVIDVIAVQDGELTSGPLLRDVARSWLRQGKSPDSFEDEYASWMNGYNYSRRVADDSAVLTELRPVNAPALIAAGGFDEAEHPRDGKGRFAKKAGGSLSAGKKLKITHGLIHSKHETGKIIAVNGSTKKRVVWDGSKYLLQEKDANGGWPTVDTAIKSKAYARVNEFDSEWHEPSEDGDGEAKVDVSAKVDIPAAESKPKKIAGGGKKSTSQPGDPIKITHGLIHQKHEPNTVIAVNGAKDKRVLWNGKEYELQKTEKSGGKWKTEKTVIKSKAYAAVNEFDSDWREPDPYSANDTAGASNTPLISDVTPGEELSKNSTGKNVPSTQGYTFQVGMAPIQGGYRFSDPDGNTWLVTPTDDADKSKTSVLASGLYAKLGFDVSQTELVSLDKKNFPGAKNGVGTQSFKVEGDTDFALVRKAVKSDAKVKDQLHESFAVDLWLGNTRTESYENLTITPDGKVVHTGFRDALGGDAYSDKFADEITQADVDKMRDQHGAFAGIDDAYIVDGLRKISGLDPTGIDNMVDAQGLSPSAAANLKSKLRSRRKSLLNLFANDLAFFDPKKPKPATPIGPKKTESTKSVTTPSVDSSKKTTPTPASTPLAATPDDAISSDSNTMDDLAHGAPYKKGMLFTDQNGDNQYVKPASAHHARNEFLAANLYTFADVAVEKTKLVDLDPSKMDGKTGMGVQTSPVPGTMSIIEAMKTNPSVKQQVNEGFAIDAWLGNWDTVGMGYDNLTVDENGKVRRTNLSGTLAYRSSGAAKGSKFTNDVNEIDTLRNPYVNPASAKIFADVTDEDIRKGVAKIEAMTPKMIDFIVSQSGFTGPSFDEMSSKLKARRLDLLKKYGSDAPAPSPSSASIPAPSTQPTSSNALNTGGVKTYGVAQKTKVKAIFDKHNVKWYNKTDAIYNAALEVSKTHSDLSMADALDIMDQSLKKKTDKPFRTKVEKWLKTKAGKQHALANGGSASIGGTSPVTPANSPSPAKPTSSNPSYGIYKKMGRASATKMQEDMDKAFPPPWSKAQRDALRTYTGGSYTTINKCARGTSPCSEQTRELIKNIKAGMKPSTEDVMVFRKTNAKAFGLDNASDMQSLVGKVIKDDGVISTSIRSNMWQGALHLEIEAPKGSMMAWVQPISLHPGEDEIVVAPGTHYEVVSVEPYSYGNGSVTSSAIYVVRLRIVPGSDAHSNDLKKAATT